MSFHVRKCFLEILNREGRVASDRIERGRCLPDVDSGRCLDEMDFAMTAGIVFASAGVASKMTLPL